MATCEYIISINSKGCVAKVRAKYRSGKFKSVELVSGKFANQEQFESLLKLTPQLEQAIIVLQSEFEGRVSWEKVEKSPATLYTQMMGVYLDWYKQKNGLPAKVTGSDGSALKQIESYFRGISSEELILEKWKSLFSNWNQLSDFYQQQQSLRQINHNLNSILRAVHQSGSTEDLNSKFSNLINDAKPKTKG